MRSSDLQHRVAFDPPAGSVNDFGEQVEAWGTPIEVRAAFRFQRSGETIMEGRLAGRETIVVTIRRNNTTRAIDGGYRMRDLNDATKVYNVKGVQPSKPGDRSWLDVLVEGGDV